MKESRVFELNQATAEQVLEAVTTFLRGEKSMEMLHSPAAPTMVYSTREIIAACPPNRKAIRSN